jgi:hypothetical protein
MEGRFRIRYLVLDEGSLSTELCIIHLLCLHRHTLLSSRVAGHCCASRMSEPERARFTGSCALLVHYLFLYLSRRYAAAYVLFVMLQDLACLEKNFHPPRASRLPLFPPLIPSPGPDRPPRTGPCVL